MGRVWVQHGWVAIFELASPIWSTSGAFMLFTIWEKAWSLVLIAYDRRYVGAAKSASIHCSFDRKEGFALRVYREAPRVMQTS